MPVTLGSMIGQDSAAADSVAVTLTAGCPAGDATTAEGLIIVTMKMQDIASGIMDLTDADVRPGVTDNAPLAPPYNLPNQLLGRMGWQGSLVVGVGAGSILYSSPGTAILWNGAFFYECLSPLSSGDVVTISYAHNAQPTTLVAADIWRVTGLRGNSLGGPEANVTQPDSSVITGAGTTAGTMPFGGDTYRFTEFMTFASMFINQDSMSAIAPLKWYGTSGLEALWPFASPLTESGHWAGTDSIDGSDPLPWRIGYAFADLETSVTDGKISVTDSAGNNTYNRSGWTFMYSDDGPGWPLEVVNPVGVYLPRRSLA